MTKLFWKPDEISANVKKNYLTHYQRPNDDLESYLPKEYDSTKFLQNFAKYIDFIVIHDTGNQVFWDFMGCFV